VDRRHWLGFCRRSSLYIRPRRHRNVNARPQGGASKEVLRKYRNDSYEAYNGVRHRKHTVPHLNVWQPWAASAFSPHAHLTPFSTRPHGHCRPVRSVQHGPWLQGGHG
jgi:hypothetical protein